MATNADTGEDGGPFRSPRSLVDELDEAARELVEKFKQAVQSGRPELLPRLPTLAEYSYDNELRFLWTDTSGERKFFTEEVLKTAGAALPMGRMVRPEEIARGVLFLVDPESESITGTTLSIDGGTQLPWWSKRGTGEF